MNIHMAKKQLEMVVTLSSVSFISDQTIIVSYRMRHIITRSSLIFYPIFEDDVFVFKEVFPENYNFMYGYYSREDII